MQAKKITTLCMVRRGGKILLGMKKRGFAEGKWNGFGGKVGETETIVQAAKRELQEECGLEALRLEAVGVLDFEYQNKDQNFQVHVFAVDEFTGEPHETEEMRPQWFNEQDVPFASMWPDDAYWLPLFLANKKFIGTFVYEGYDTILHHTLKEVEGFDNN